MVAWVALRRVVIPCVLMLGLVPAALASAGCTAGEKPVLGATAVQQSRPQSPDDFVAAKPGEIQESLPATPFVFIAYGFVWLALAVYVFFMWRRLARVERDIADVRGRLQRGG
jgi:CcmD family protein